MKLQRLLRIFILFVLFFSIFSLGYSADSRVLRLGHVVQVNHSWDLTVKEFANLINERTNNRYEIEIYPARQLGGDRDMFESIQVGALDMGVISSAIIENWTPVFTSLQLPWLFKDYDVQKKAYKSVIAQKMLDELSSYSIKGLAIYDCGFRHFLNKVRPINKPEDMEGIKFRAVESPLVMNLFKLLGGEPTPMPYGEIYSAVQTGVVQGLDIGWKAGYDEKFFEVAKYYSISSHFSFPTVLIINKQLFDSLPPEDQDIFEKTAYELIDYNFRIFIEQESEELKKQVQELGVQVNYIEDTSQFRNKMEPIYEDYKAKHQLIKDFVNYVDNL